jgi:hypothetical protein
LAALGPVVDGAVSVVLEYLDLCQQVAPPADSETMQRLLTPEEARGGPRRPEEARGGPRRPEEARGGPRRPEEALTS